MELKVDAPSWEKKQGREEEKEKEVGEKSNQWMVLEGIKVSCEEKWREWEK